MKCSEFHINSILDTIFKISKKACNSSLPVETFAATEKGQIAIPRKDKDNEDPDFETSSNSAL